MKKYFKHFWIISKHKYYVLIECFERGLFWQGIVHDLSKYSFIEFFTSAKYFQGDRTPIAIEKAEKGYSIAWLNHKAKNKHHWEYWTDFKNGKLLLCPIPNKYILEMACDMVGASKAYSTGYYNPYSPYNYFFKEKDNILMRDDDKEKLALLLKRFAQQ